jgi:hypothetical protein
MSPPDNSGVRALPIKPWPNDVGKVTRVLMRLARPIAALLSATRVSMAWNVRTTPFGRPVVPEVKRMSAGSFGLLGEIGAGAVVDPATWVQARAH